MANILLVEDDLAMLETLSLAMRSKGHNVATAHNGEEGLANIADSRFDLVVTDILMPQVDGLGMIDEVKRVAPQIKVLAISGGGIAVNFDFLDAAKRHGAVATLEKPFPISEFYSALEKCLAG
jgi:DNA-binding NtrC family response regulator